MNSQRQNRPRRGRRMDKTGRSIGEAHHVRLYGWFLKTPAWQSLSTQAVAVYIAIAQRYFGSNNGEISLSVREAARLVSIAKDTARRSFDELEAKGFIRRNVCGSFNWKSKQATTWILTEHSYRGELPTKDFMPWTLENPEVGPKRGTRCPEPGTTGRRVQTTGILNDIFLGLWALSCTVPRSQITARI